MKTFALIAFVGFFALATSGTSNAAKNGGGGGGGDLGDCWVTVIDELDNCLCAPAYGGYDGCDRWWVDEAGRTACAAWGSCGFAGSIGLQMY